MRSTAPAAAGEHDWLTSGPLTSGVTTPTHGSARSRAVAGLGRDVRVPSGAPRLAKRTFSHLRRFTPTSQSPERSPKSTGQPM